MAFENLSPDEKRVVWECMNAIHNGNFIDDYEFQTRLGLEKDELANIISAYPNLKDGEALISTGINNCLNEITYGLEIAEDKWPVWLSVPRERVKEVYNKWMTLIGMKSTGIM